MRITVPVLVAAIAAHVVAVAVLLWATPLWLAVPMGALAGWNIASFVRGIRFIRARQREFERAYREMYIANGVIFMRDVQ